MRDELRIGDWVVHPLLNQMTGPGGEIHHLEPRAMAVLMELASTPGEVRTRDELLEAVWGGDAFVGEAVLTHSIWELRRTFGDRARDPKYIQTIPRRGYRLVAEVVAAEGMVLRAALLHGEGPRETLRLFDRPIDALGAALEVSRSDPPSPCVIHLAEIPTGYRAPSGCLTELVSELPTGLLLAHAVLAVARSGQVLLTRGAFDLSRLSSDELDGEARQLAWLARGTFALSPTLVEALVENGAVGFEDSPELELFEVSRQGSPGPPPRSTDNMQRSLSDGIIEGWRAAQGLTIPQRAHWRLRRKLGEGGFGEVWLAAHEVTRELRVFKFCYRADRLRALQREVTLFRLIKETLGRRRDIVRILDWSFEEPPYFLEIEHSDSGSLLEWAEEQDGLDQVPLRQRLELVAQVADALAAAHSVGVLHKDVKPGNVLVEKGEGSSFYARLTDFGIGQVVDRRALDQAGITALGISGTATRARSPSDSGTRLYQAPEVLEGRPFTIRADLYALGVMLYQMVVGGFDRALAVGWERQVDDELLIETIAACVDGSPERRPASATELAESLRALDSRRQERREHRQRDAESEANRLALVASQKRRKTLALFAVVAVVVLAVVSVFAVQANRARQRAEAATREADQRRQQAEGLIGFMLGDLRQKLEPVSRLDVLDDVSDRAMAYFEQVPEGRWSDVERSRRALALRQIGEVKRLRGDLEAAEAAFRDSLELAQELAETAPGDSDRHVEYCAALFWVGQLRFDQGDLTEARIYMQRYLDIARKWLETNPSDEVWLLELAQATSNVGSIAEQAGDLEAALEAYGQRLNILQDLVAQDPTREAWSLDLALAHNTLGVVREKLGELEMSREHFQAELGLNKKLADADPKDLRRRQRLATSHYFLGESSRKLGLLDEARSHFETELAITRDLVARDPENREWHRHLGVAQRSLGWVLVERSDDRGWLLLEQAVATMRGLTEAEPEHREWLIQLATSHVILGELLAKHGRLDEARAEGARALEVFERVQPAEPYWQRRAEDIARTAGA